MAFPRISLLSIPSSKAHPRVAAWLRIIGVAALVMGLQACSAVRLGYEHSPELAYWWLDSYLDFDNAQARQVRASLDSIQQWHRHQELPKVAALLQQAQALVQREPSADEICQLADSARQRARALADRAIPAMARIAPELSIDQLETLRKKYLASNADYRHEWMDLSPKERREKRVDQIAARAEKVYGTLETPQRDAISAAVKRSSFNPEIELGERKRRQGDVMTQLRLISTRKMSTVAARETVEGLIDRAFDSPDPQYRHYQKTLFRETCEAFSKVQSVMNAEQRSTARKRLAQYEQDTRELAAEPES
jgi:hypothetical protein